MVKKGKARSAEAARPTAGIAAVDCQGAGPGEQQTAGCGNSTVGCCCVEAVVGVDDRGQMVLPKELREKAGIRAGDKLAVVGMERDGRMCCISLIKVDDLADMVKTMLGPVMKEIFQ
jgi:AbrB family looped-hinge helix DNA binding protein